MQGPICQNRALGDRRERILANRPASDGEQSPQSRSCHRQGFRPGMAALRPERHVLGSTDIYVHAVSSGFDESHSMDGTFRSACLEAAVLAQILSRLAF